MKDLVVTDAYAGMGRCLAKEGKRDYAVKFFNKALAAGPSLQTRDNVEKELDELSGPKPSDSPDLDRLIGN